MADTFLFANNAKSTLASGITNIQTTLITQPGEGALFPSPGAGQHFPVTLVDASGKKEVAYCTSRSSDTFTILRAHEGTTGRAFASADAVELRWTKGTAEQAAQKALTENKADSVMLLLMNAKTGEILAYVSTPSFDPNNFSRFNTSSMLNRPIRAAYEPGSVFKIFSISSSMGILNFTDDDKTSYGLMVLKLLSDKGFYSSIRKNAIDSGENYTVDNMANNFKQGIIACLNEKN